MSAGRRYAYRGGIMFVDFGKGIGADGRTFMDGYHTYFGKDENHCRRFFQESMPVQKTFKAAQKDLDKWAAARCLEEVVTDGL